jgi:hypothetical protein
VLITEERDLGPKYFMGDPPVRNIDRGSLKVKKYLLRNDKY